MATTQCRHTPHGRMAKLVDALDLGSSGETHQSSNLCTPTNFYILREYLLSHYGVCVSGARAHASGANW